MIIKNIIPYILLVAAIGFAGDITIDVSKNRKPVSPYIYGRNNSISDNPSNPTSTARWKLYNDAGVRFFRESGGNNSTKYNWNKKLTSHPDWYNNVYAHDWDFQLQSLAGKSATAVGMWTLQLIGWAATNTQNNFDDWNYNGSQWWEGVTNNWAGDGDPNLYLENWPADSTVGILSSWLDSTIDPAFFQYWEMDNEPEIWSGTHDDVMPQQISAEDFMQHYFDVAKKARALFPDMKIMGPVPANEWQWYNWNNDKISYKGKSYTWLEYFIMRIAEEQAVNGIRLLDVISLHFYPGESNPADIVQLHRVWFDENFIYPGANGVKRSGTGGWDNSINKEYVFQRCRDWLDTYLGADNRVTLAVTEMGVNSDDPNVNANWYASTLGEFARQGVEIFTPWSWKTGHWEVLHLFSRYFQTINISSVSDIEEVLSAYASVNENADSMSVIFVNRNLNDDETTNVNLQNYLIADGSYKTMQLAELPGNETFMSHENNALKPGTVSLTDNTFSLTLPPLSVTVVLLQGEDITGIEKHIPENPELAIEIYPNPFNPQATISYTLSKMDRVYITIFDQQGRIVKKINQGIMPAGKHDIIFDGKNLSSGIYFVQLRLPQKMIGKKLILLK
jgi:Glycoside hydrolase family 44/Secretion system C-terminal sorting domain